jgi:hypothetical protein
MFKRLDKILLNKEISLGKGRWPMKKLLKIAIVVVGGPGPFIRGTHTFC